MLGVFRRLPRKTLSLESVFFFGLVAPDKLVSSGSVSVWSITAWHRVHDDLAIGRFDGSSAVPPNRARFQRLWCTQSHTAVEVILLRERSNTYVAHGIP